MERPFFGRIESLRGIGCLMVAGYHAHTMVLHGIPLFQTAQRPEAGWLQRIVAEIGLLVMPGHAALMMFFVISGFVLRISLQFGPQGIAAATTRFFIARVFRIYPIIIFSTLVAALLLIWTSAGAFGQPPLTWANLLANVTLLHVGLNPVLWAIQVEVLVAPFILLFYFVERRFGPKTVFAIAVAATPIAFTGWLIWQPFSHNFFAFVLGLTVPTIGRDFVQGLSPARAKLLTLALLPVLLLPGHTIGFYSQYSAVIEGYGSFLLVSLAASRGDVKVLGWLDAKPLRLLGLCSGSYYVLHSFFVPAAAVVAAFVIAESWCTNVPAFAMWAAVFVFLAMMFPIALASYFLVEAPGIALGRYLNRALQPRRLLRATETAAEARSARAGGPV